VYIKSFMYVYLCQAGQMPEMMKQTAL